MNLEDLRPLEGRVSELDMGGTKGTGRRQSAASSPDPLPQCALGGRWLPNWGLHCPALLVSRWDPRTSCHQWNRNGSDVCHFHTDTGVFLSVFLAWNQSPAVQRMTGACHRQPESLNILCRRLPARDPGQLSVSEKRTFVVLS